MVTVDSVLKEFNTCRKPEQDYEEDYFFYFDIQFKIHFDTNRKCWILNRIFNPLYKANLQFGRERCHFLNYIGERQNKISLNAAKDYSVFSVSSPQLGVIRNGDTFLVQTGDEGFFDINNRPEEQMAHGTITDDALYDIKDLCLFTSGYGGSGGNFNVYLYPKINGGLDYFRINENKKCIRFICGFIC